MNKSVFGKTQENHRKQMRVEQVSVSSFSLNTIFVEVVELEIKSLNSSKASFHNNIPVKNLKENWDISSPVEKSLFLDTFPIYTIYNYYFLNVFILSISFAVLLLETVSPTYTYSQRNIVDS